MLMVYTKKNFWGYFKVPKKWLSLIKNNFTCEKAKKGESNLDCPGHNFGPIGLPSNFLSILLYNRICIFFDKFQIVGPNLDKK